MKNWASAGAHSYNPIPHMKVSFLNHKSFIWDKHKIFVPLSCTYTSSCNINKCKSQTPDAYCPQNIPHFESWQPRLLGHTSIVPNLSVMECSLQLFPGDMQQPTLSEETKANDLTAD